MEQSAFGQHERGKLVDEDLFCLFLCFTGLTDAFFHRGRGVDVPRRRVSDLTFNRFSLQSANRLQQHLFQHTSTVSSDVLGWEF